MGTCICIVPRLLAVPVDGVHPHRELEHQQKRRPEHGQSSENAHDDIHHLDSGAGIRGAGIEHAHFPFGIDEQMPPDW